MANIGSAAVEKPVSQNSNQISRLKEAVSDSESITASLFGRFDQLLKPPEPTTPPKQEPEPGAQPMAPLACELENIAEQLSATNNLLRNLLDRCEI